MRHRPRLDDSDCVSRRRCGGLPVASRDPGGLALYGSAGRCSVWLDNEWLAAGSRRGVARKGTDRLTDLISDMPAAVSHAFDRDRRAERAVGMAAVMIGVDPHKGSHTAVAIDAEEVPLGRLR